MADAVLKLVEHRAVVKVDGGELIALRAAQAVAPLAIRAETALQAIMDVAAGAPDAPSVVNKINLTGDNLVNVADKSLLIGALRASTGGFWTDDGPGAVVWRMTDRVLMGDAVNYSGGRLGTGVGLGTDWLTTRWANYVSKNSQVMALATNRIGFTAGSYTPPGAGSLVNIGISGWTANEGVNSTGRAGYLEAFHKPSTGGSSYGLEIQVGNYTNVAPNPTPYGIGNTVTGLYLAVQGGLGYVTGNSNTPIAPPTYGAGCAIDIGGGDNSGTLRYQRWHSGIIFRTSALDRDVDGFTGVGLAIRMAQRHQIQWDASATLIGAKIRSDVTANAGQDMGLIFSNNRASITGTAETEIVGFASAANAVNNITLRNAATSSGPSIEFSGADTNVSALIQTKGQGVIVFRSHGGAGESIRFNTPSTAPVNALNLSGSIAGGPVLVGAIGADTNIDIRLQPKAAGLVRFGAFTSSGAVAVNGSVLIRTDDGVTRKLATIA